MKQLKQRISKLFINVYDYMTEDITIGTLDMFYMVIKMYFISCLVSIVIKVIKIMI